MVVYMMRVIQHIYSDKWAEWTVLDKKMDELETKMGFPPKKKYKMVSGRDNIDTLQIEREYKSMKQFEDLLIKWQVDPEIQKLAVEIPKIVKDQSNEVLMVL